MQKASCAWECLQCMTCSGTPAMGASMAHEIVHALIKSVEGSMRLCLLDGRSVLQRTDA